MMKRMLRHEMIVFLRTRWILGSDHRLDINVASQHRHDRNSPTPYRYAKTMGDTDAHNQHEILQLRYKCLVQSSVTKGT